MKRRLTKTEQWEIFWAVMRTTIGWGIDREEAAKSSVVYLGGLLLFSSPLCIGIVILLDSTLAAGRSNVAPLLILGLVGLIVWVFPVGGCLYAWWVGGRIAQQETRRLTGRIILLHPLPSIYLGTRPSMLAKIETSEGSSKLFLVGPRLTSRLHMRKTIQIEYMPLTEFVVDIQSIPAH